MDISQKIRLFTDELGTHTRLIAVSKTYPAEAIAEAYSAGQRDFGENKVQEMVAKYEVLPKDIRWHLIGHLQRNKVKYIAPFVHLIHSVDSLPLLMEINKEAKKNNRIINCLLQLHVAKEETKFGMSFIEAEDLLVSEQVAALENSHIIGLMAMASNTEEASVIEQEFAGVKSFFERMKTKLTASKNIQMHELSMGMSGDYQLAIKHGSTMVRVGSSLFGTRTYT